ncbi:MAG TPA: RagB/SusD family nutrient uptake outer membrane protein, partial [Chryseolinea sp.]
LTLFCLGMSCEDFLDKQPQGTTTLNALSEQTNGAEALLIAAYSNLDGYSISRYDEFTGSGSNWTFGSIAGGDAYKGSDEADQPAISEIEKHTDLTSINVYLEAKWITYYNGIARANDAIKAFRSLPSINENFEKFRQTRLAEARFLRGFFHFELRRTFGKVPYIDDSIIDVRIGNAEDILIKIQNDFLYAAEHLPPVQDQRGRATRGAANAYMGITKMWQKDYLGAIPYFDAVINSGIYQLSATFHQNFNVEYKNVNAESILEVQQTVNDGAFGLNANPGDVLTLPGYDPNSCCGFHTPSQNLANAFQTDVDGLPLLDSYNDTDIINDDKLDSDDPFTPHAGPLDPRIDWTIGRRGIPYFDRGIHVGEEWIRGGDVFAGPYSSKKYILYASQENDFSERSWTPAYTANNFKLLRYADVLLYAAEAEVESGNLDRAMELVNRIRNRAANPAGWVYTYVDPDNPSQGYTNTPAANYFIKPYPSGHFTANGNDYARKAVRFERRLELAMEGHRFFDLVRWGIAAEERNAYFEKEKIKRVHLQTAHFKKGTHEVFPIPQKAIDLSSKDGVPTLVQNEGYE